MHSKIANRLPPTTLIQLLFGITAIVILAIGGKLTFDVVVARRAAMQMVQVNQLIDHLFDVAAELAYERGLTTRRLVSDPRPKAIGAQRAEVDTLWRRAEAELGTLPKEIKEGIPLDLRLERIRAGMVRVQRLREDIDGLAAGTPAPGMFQSWFAATTGVITQIRVLREQLSIAVSMDNAALAADILLKRELWNLIEASGHLRVLLGYHASAGAPDSIAIIEDLRQRTDSIEQDLHELLAQRAAGRVAPALHDAVDAFERHFRTSLDLTRLELEAMAGKRSRVGGDRLFDAATQAIDAARALATAQAARLQHTIKEIGAALGLRLAVYVAFAVGATIFAWLSLSRVRLQAHDLFVQKELAETTLQSIGDAVIATDAEGVIEYLNPVAEHLTGWTLAEARGMRFNEIFKVINHTRASEVDPVGTCLRQGTVIGLSGGHSLIRRDGSEVRIEDSAAPIRDRDNNVVGAVVVFFSVDQQPHDHLLVYQATRDTLTGLINRREFERRLDDLVASAKLNSGAHVLGYIDLDQFKIVNDTCGHAAGDEMLRQVVFLLRKRVRGSDVLGRLGGDEFGLLLYNCPMEQARELAEALRAAIREFRFCIRNRVFECGLSIGLVPITALSQSGEELLSQADSACYMAKEKGRNRVHVYDAADRDLARHHGDMQWVPRLGEALRENRFTLFGQRIRPLAPGLPEHVEVLIRLRGEDGVLIPPMTFIPAAERYGLIGDLDRWVIKHTFALMAEAEGAVRNTVFNINLSGNSIGDKTLVDFIRGAAAQYGIDPGSVCFEITETAAIREIRNATALMEMLGRDGYSFALDDFGSGLSSFSYLKSLAVQTIKIDGAFIRRLSEQSLDYVMVQSVVSVGRLLKMRTVAEFVENETALSIVRQLGVDYAQGFHVAEPQPLAAAVSALNSRRGSGCEPALDQLHEG